MNPFLHRSLRLVVLGVAALTALPSNGHAANIPRAAQAEAELAEVQQQIQALGDQIVRDRGQQDQILVELRTLEQRIVDAQRELATLARQQQVQGDQIRESQIARQGAAERLAAQQQQLARQMQAAYLMGDSSQIRLLLLQDDPTEIPRLHHYLTHLNRARIERIEHIRTLADQLTEAEQLLASRQAKLATLVARQKNVLDALEGTRAARGKVVDALTRRLDEADDILKRLARDERELQTLLESLRDLLADIPRDAGQQTAFRSLRGRLPRPATGRVLARYGQVKNGTQVRWKGQWIGAAADTPVRAVADGRVAFVGWLNRFGLMVIVEHDEHHYTLYGHQSAADVQVGQWVQSGQTLGRAGDSGGQQHTGVYFEIRRGTQAVDPAAWFSR